MLFYTWSFVFSYANKPGCNVRAENKTSAELPKTAVTA